MSILFIDNFDSFTYNLVTIFLELGIKIDLIKNNSKIPDLQNYKAIVISPGPSTPQNSKLSLEILNNTTLPVLGICLGHQTIAYNYGAKIVKAPKAVHGKMSLIKHNNKNLFHGLKDNFLVTRYHSLIIDENSLPDCFDIDARSDDNLIMAISHKDKKLFGVQFHPESITTCYGKEIINNFIRVSKY